jgi:hypothetical protein
LETFCEHASRNKLHGKKKNTFFGPTDQKLWMFEVSRRSLGRAGMCWSQPARVDHLRKKWRVDKKKNSRKMGTARQAQVLTRDRPPAMGQHLRLSSCSKFFNFLNLKRRNFWKFGKWARAFERMGV